MAKRKSFGNPLSKALGKALDEVAPRVLDSAMDIVPGPKKSKKAPSSVVGPFDRLGHPAAGFAPPQAALTEGTRHTWQRSSSLPTTTSTPAGGTWPSPRARRPAWPA